MSGIQSKVRKLPIRLELPTAAAVSGAVGGLKQLLGPGVKIGCALGGVPTKLSPAERALVLEHFDAVTPENCMKPGPIQPREGIFDFETPDALVAFAQAYHLEMTGHCLAWHQQTADWFFQEGDGPGSREVVLSRLRQHIHAVMDRYRGRIKGWDVVNEAIADHGPSMLRDSIWTRTVGDDFVEQAFRLADEADPHSLLYYNDYNIELPAKRDKTFKLLRQLLDKGVRVDGVGIQGHWVLNQVPYDDIERAILAYHSLGLKVMITELDLDIMERPDCGAEISWQAQKENQFDPYAGGCPPEAALAHAEQYARLFELFAAHRDKLARITFWGLHDGTSWLNDWPWKRKNFALLFDRASEPKLAFHEAVTRVAAVIAGSDRRV